MSTLDGLMENLEAQRAYLANRVPVYARILELLPDVLPRERLEAVWGGRLFGAWYERPLLILAGLRDDVLELGAEHPLYFAIGRDARVDVVTREALEAALGAGQPLWHKLGKRHVQTNETSRAVAWMWPAHLMAMADPGCTLHLFDIGTSAGLNLIADRLPRIWSRADGRSLPVDPLPRIETRRGYDLRPLDVSGEEGARWLRACVWPGQGHREERLDQAIAAWRSANPRPELVTAGAGDVPDLLPHGGFPREVDRMLAFQTVMRDYLPETERARYERGMRDWLASSRPGRSVWIELELTDAASEGGPVAVLTAHVRDATIVLGRCEPHPRVIDVDDLGAQELVGQMR